MKSQDARKDIHMENTINYACTCGQTWQRTYQVEIKSTGIVHLTRILEPGAPPNDALCNCGELAAARLSTPMLGYTKVVVKLLIAIAQAHHCSGEELERLQS